MDFTKVAMEVVEKVGAWEIKNKRRSSVVRISHTELLAKAGRSIPMPELWLELNEAFIPLGWALVIYGPAQLGLVRISRMEVSLGIGI
jgi:hypothetical protein